MLLCLYYKNVLSYEVKYDLIKHLHSSKHLLDWCMLRKAREI